MVSSESFGAFIQEEIFKPANMHHSFVYASPSSIPLHASPYSNATGYKKAPGGRWKECWGAPALSEKVDQTVGDGGIWSNLDDMLRFDVAIREQRLLKRDTMDLALTPAKTLNGVLTPHGLGWRVYRNRGNEVIGYGHDGHWNGFNTSFYYYCVKDRTTVILSNRHEFDPDQFWYALNRSIDQYLP